MKASIEKEETLLDSLPRELAIHTIASIDEPGACSLSSLFLFLFVVQYSHWRRVFHSTYDNGRCNTHEGALRCEGSACRSSFK